MKPAALAVGILFVGAALVLAGLGASSTVSSPRTVAPLSAGSVNLPNLTRQGLVLPMGDLNGTDGLQVGYPSVLFLNGSFQMWYFEVQASPWYAQIATATSADGRNWTKQGTVLSPTLPEESFDVAYPTVTYINGTYWMWYNGYDGISTYRIFAATSPDGIHWTKDGVVLDVGATGSADVASVPYPFVLYDNGTFYMWYTGLTSFNPPDNAAIMLATSENGLNWTKQGVVLTPGTDGGNDSYNLFTAGVAKEGSTFVMIYMGQSQDGTSHMLWAVSLDGIHWDKMGLALAPDPPAEDSVGQADPVILPDGTWMVYYAVRNYTSDIQIYLASSASAVPLPPSPPPPPPPSGNGSSPSPPSPAAGSPEVASSPEPVIGSSWALPLALVAVAFSLGGAVAGAPVMARVLRRRRPPG